MTAHPIYSHKTLALILCGLMLLFLSLSNRAEEITGTLVEGAAPQPLQAKENIPAPVNPDQTSLDQEIEAQIKQHFEHFTPPSPESLSAGFNQMLLVPIVAIIVVIGGGFLFIIALVVTRYRAAAQRRVQHQELIQKFLDAGRDVPDELLIDFDGKNEANLSKGIKDTLIGLAIMIFLTALIGFEIGAAGLIIVAAGLSRLAIWKLSQPKKSV